VIAHLARDPFSAAAPMRLSVTMAADGAATRGVLAWTMGDRPAQREVSGETCEKVAAALALTLAVALDPFVAGGPERGEHDPAADPAAEPAPEETPDPVTPEDPRAGAEVAKPPVDAASLARKSRAAHLARTVAPSGPARRRAWRLSVLGEALVSSGAAPEIAGAGALGLRVQRRSLAGFARVQLGQRRDQSLRVGSLSAGLALASIGACYAPHWLSACAVGSAGVVSGRGRAPLEDRQSKLRPHAALGSRVARELPLGAGFYGSIFAEAHATLIRTTFTVSGMPAWTTPRWLLSTGVSTRFEF